MYTKQNSDEIASDQLIRVVLTSLGTILKNLHANDQYHGHIKPENVIIDAVGNLEILAPELCSTSPVSTGNKMTDSMLAHISQEFCPPE